MQDSEDYYVVFEGSDDDDEGVSSDDEEDESFWGELYKFQNPKKSKQRLDADAFELEMNQELNVTMKQLQGTGQLAICDASTSGTNTATATATTSQGVLVENKKQNEFYDDAYFDSDSSGDEENGQNASKKSKRRHPVMSNDDLFYDPDMDTEDQKWVDARRRYNSATSSAIAELAAAGEGASASSTTRAVKPKLKPLPNSDAVLNCPACMCTLCRDCQRHATYKGQYRAMFVENCEIDTSQSMSYPSSKQKRFKKKDTDRQADPQEDLFHPVKCAECKTEVAVYDKDEVYHFHNVLSSFT